jgi:uncharacterized RDD family membrane protein YckC
MVDRLWQQLLVSEEVEQLFVRIGDAPEIRTAIASQSSGLVRDLGIGAQRLVQRLDDRLENAIRRLFRRAARATPSRHAGLASRGLAFAIDFAIIDIAFLVVSGLVAFLVSALTDTGSASTGVLVAGAGFWLAAGGLYFASHWALAGQTPGMHFVGLQLDSDVGRRIGVRRAVRRLLGLAVAVIPLGIGLLAIAMNVDRRGWQDWFAQTDVGYVAPADAPG